MHLATRKVRTKQRWLTMVTAGIFLIATVAACGSSGGSTETSTSGGLQKLKLGVTLFGPAVLPLTVGVKRGIFKAHGIDLEMTHIKTSPLAAAALASNSVDLAAMQEEATITVNAAGGDLKIVGNLLGELPYHLILGKGISSISQLSGKKAGATGVNNGNADSLRYVLDQNGVDSKKVTVVAVGSQPAILAALLSGQVQTGLLVSPYNLQAKDQGLKDVGDLRKYFPHVTSSVIVGQQSSLKNNSKLVKNFLAAVAESTKWVADNPEGAVRILAKADNLTADVAQASYDQADGAWPVNAAVDKTGLQFFLDFMKKYNLLESPVSADKVYTEEYLPHD